MSAREGASSLLSKGVTACEKLIPLRYPAGRSGRFTAGMGKALRESERAAVIGQPQGIVVR